VHTNVRLVSGGLSSDHGHRVTGLVSGFFHSRRCLPLGFHTSVPHWTRGTPGRVSNWTSATCAPERPNHWALPKRKNASQRGTKQHTDAFSGLRDPTRQVGSLRIVFTRCVGTRPRRGCTMPGAHAPISPALRPNAARRTRGTKLLAPPPHACKAVFIIHSPAFAGLYTSSLYLDMASCSRRETRVMRPRYTLPVEIGLVPPSRELRAVCR